MSDDTEGDMLQIQETLAALPCLDVTKGRFDDSKCLQLVCKYRGPEVVLELMNSRGNMVDERRPIRYWKRKDRIRIFTV